jgi:hypothetical protein
MTRRFLPLLASLPLMLLCICQTSFAQKIPVVNLENQVVQKFMSHGPYSGFGTQASYFDNKEEFPERFA